MFKYIFGATAPAGAQADSFRDPAPLGEKIDDLRNAEQAHGDRREVDAVAKLG